MWTCPRCQHRFVNKNQSHSCGKHTVRGFIRGKNPEAVSLFKYFVNQYRKIGPFRFDPVKTRVALLTQIRFCAINRIGDDYIDVHFVLTEPHPGGDCIRRIDNLANRFYIHHARFYKKSDINREVVKYMKRAYDVGNRLHIAKMRRQKS